MIICQIYNYEGYGMTNKRMRTLQRALGVTPSGVYDPSIGTTIAVGGTLGASAGIRGATSFAFVGDNKENAALQGSFSAGGGGLQAPGGSLSIAVTNAPNVDALEGWGSQVGGSLTICFITVGADYLIIPNSEGDDYHGVSINLGLSSVPFWIDYIPDITMNFDTSERCPTRLLGSVYVQGMDLFVRYTFTKNKSYSLFTVMGIVISVILGLVGVREIWLSFYGQGKGGIIGSWFLLYGILFFWLSSDQMRIKKSQKVKLVNFLKEAVER